MNALHLKNADLNLLVVLLALLETRSVTAAAAQLGASQSATSHALSRLRALFDDPLLVRAGRGMIPTPRADALRQPLEQHLGGLGRLLRPRLGFDPGSAQRTFRIASEDYFSTVVLPTLLARITPEASGVAVEILARAESPVEGLADGTYDLQAGVAKRSSPRGLKRQILFADEMVCLLRQGHPVGAGALDIPTYARLSHVMVGVGARGPTSVDDELAKHGLRRHIACRVAHFVAAPAVVAKTDMVLTLPERLAAELSAEYGLRVLPTPLPRIRFRYAQFWHPVMHEDPGHRWFRAQVREAARSL